MVRNAAPEIRGAFIASKIHDVIARERPRAAAIPGASKPQVVQRTTFA